MPTESAIFGELPNIPLRPANRCARARENSLYLRISHFISHARAHACPLLAFLTSRSTSGHAFRPILSLSYLRCSPKELSSSRTLRSAIGISEEEHERTMPGSIPVNLPSIAPLSPQRIFIDRSRAHFRAANAFSIVRSLETYRLLTGMKLPNRNGRSIGAAAKERLAAAYFTSIVIINDRDL